MLDGVPITFPQLGLTGLVTFFVVLIYTGRLVPNRFYERALEQIDVLMAASAKKDETINTQSMTIQTQQVATRLWNDALADAKREAAKDAQPDEERAV